jgi:hypothetical protein
MDGLTQLERELLTYVEQLTLASKASAEALGACEAQWTQETKAELDGLKLCVIGLVRSQASLIAVLGGWMREDQIYEQLSSRLKISLETIKKAETHLTTD